MTGDRMLGGGAQDAMTDDLACILIRAGQLGFSAARVATALNISPNAFASLDPAASSHRPPNASPVDAHSHR
jgi:hypothetical protein